MAKMVNFKMGDKKPKQNFHQKKKKNNLVLVFDESARKEYLTGFRKRNQEKRKKKKEEFEKQLKQEKKRIKAEAKQAFKSLIHKRKVIPELEDLINEEIDMGTHTVQIAELSSNQIAEENNFIGENQVRYEEEKNESDHEERMKPDSNFVEGMETKNKKQKQKLIAESNSADFRTAKDVKRAIMHQVAQKVQNSKIFRKKNQIERMRNIKRNKREQKKRERRERLQSGSKKPKRKKGK